jgi:hypothetical protein
MDPSFINMVLTKAGNFTQFGEDVQENICLGNIFSPACLAGGGGGGGRDIMKMRSKKIAADISSLRDTGAS